MISTATDLHFTGGREGYFYAFGARSGQSLWKTNLGGSIVSAAITYATDGRHYVLVICGNILSTFALRN
jgi:alcohol dehydrogenase (cytochrome c)